MTALFARERQANLIVYKGNFICYHRDRFFSFFTLKCLSKEGLCYVQLSTD